MKNETLDQFVYFLSNLNLPMDINSEILTIIVKEYPNLNQETQWRPRCSLA